MAEDLQLQAVVSSKKRKMYAEMENEELQVNCLSPVTSFCENELSVGGNSGGSPDLENVELQSEESETEISTSGDGVFSREATPTSQLSRESPRRGNPVMPSEAELEEFFAEIEMSHQKQFAEKYNYDIVKDEPLEGKYEWVLLEGAN